MDDEFDDLEDLIVTTLVFASAVFRVIQTHSAEAGQQLRRELQREAARLEQKRPQTAASLRFLLEQNPPDEHPPKSG